MAIDEKREELRRQVEALNEVQAALQRVEAHAKYLGSVPVIDRNDFQRVWMAAYDSCDLKLAKGSEDTMREVALNLASLDRLREITTNDYVPTMEEERPRFSFFGRRRR